MSYFSQVAIADGPNLDAFSRLRVSNPTYVFDAQFTYDLRPLLFELITANGGGGTATVAFDSTNRCALMTFTAAQTGGKAYMQSFEWMPYQPGRSQLAFITFNMNSGVTNVRKFAGLGDTTNGIFLELNGATLQASVYSGTASTDTVVQASWNIDKMNGSGPSGITIDMSKTQILVIDYQALYVGRVRLGFDINGIVYYFHQFVHSNLITVPYIQIASLPVSCGMTCTGTVSTTMQFICSSVISEGGSADETGIPYSFNASTAGATSIPNGSPLHIMSLQPRLTFNSITNRMHLMIRSFDVYVSGNNPIRVDILLGQAISGTTTFNDVNTTYSGMAYNTAGTLSGSPAIILDSLFVAATKSVGAADFTQKLPITLDAAGAARLNGTITVQATGLGGTSGCSITSGWTEVR